jgi:hypothetical protein
MPDISFFSSDSKQRTHSTRSIATAQSNPSKKPRITVGLLDAAGNLTGTLTFEGRGAFALDQLIKAGQRGCTPIDNPAPRWAHYVYKLRRVGLSIQTHDEAWRTLRRSSRSIRAPF